MEEHDEILRKVLQRARERKIEFNKKKMKFRITEVKYIGDVITGDGLKPDDSKIKAICDFITPAKQARCYAFASHGELFRKVHS